MAPLPKRRSICVTVNSSDFSRSLALAPYAMVVMVELPRSAGIGLSSSSLSSLFARHTWMALVRHIPANTAGMGSSHGRWVVALGLARTCVLVLYAQGVLRSMRNSSVPGAKRKRAHSVLRLYRVARGIW